MLKSLFVAFENSECNVPQDAIPHSLKELI